MLGDWREAFRRRGMRQISVWVRKEIAKPIQDFFSRVSADNEEGEGFRQSLQVFSLRKRPILSKYDGLFLNFEADWPVLTVGSKKYPFGGRIYGDGETLIELDSFEATAVHKSCQEAVNNVLAAWLAEHSLKGVIRDQAGVVLDWEFHTRNHKPHSSDIIDLPETEEERISREEAIRVSHERRAYHDGGIAPDDPFLHYYLGFHRIPSRCQIVHGSFDGRICVGFIHVRHGGTSPTNAIEQLVEEIWKKKYSANGLNQVEWYDIWPDHLSASTGTRFRRVELEVVKGKPANPCWLDGDSAPPSFIDRVKFAIDHGRHAEVIAYNKANSHKGWKHLISEEVRESYGEFHVDILIEENPRIEAIAVLGSWPVGNKYYGRPYLFISKPGKYEFRDVEQCAAIAAHWPEAQALFDKGTLLEWDDPDLLSFCRWAGLPFEAAREHYTRAAGQHQAEHA